MTESTPVIKYLISLICSYRPLKHCLFVRILDFLLFSKMGYKQVKPLAVTYKKWYFEIWKIIIFFSMKSMLNISLYTKYELYIKYKTVNLTMYCIEGFRWWTISEESPWIFNHQWSSIAIHGTHRVSCWWAIYRKSHVTNK